MAFNLDPNVDQLAPGWVMRSPAMMMSVTVSMWSTGSRWLVSNAHFHAPRRNRPKPAPPERTLSDSRRPADQITLPEIAIFGGGRSLAV